MSPFERMQVWAWVFLVAVGLGGCATTPTNPEALAANDPFETTNRETLKLNDRIDRNVLDPIENLYRRLLPAGGGHLVHNVIHNISSPVFLLNDILQGEAKRAGQTLGRLVINSTLGLGGIFDPAADRLQIPPHDEDFGQTLAVWGVGEGPYVILPVLGPLPPRDGVGQVADAALNPLNHIHFKQHLWWEAGRYTAELVDLRSQNHARLEEIERSSIDYYAALRSMYRQVRSHEIRNGRPDVQSLPDL